MSKPKVHIAWIPSTKDGRHLIVQGVKQPIQTKQFDSVKYLEIDGKVYADAKGVFNRHNSNSPYFHKVGLFGWSQAGTEPFTIEYDDVIISNDGYATP